LVTKRKNQKNNMFRKARIKLTAYYILILTAIMIIVSAFVYRGVLLSAERALTMHEHRIEMGLQKYRNRDPYELPLGFQKPITEKTIKEIKSEILRLLEVINGTILVIAGGLSYLLAGLTLKPIQEMMEKQKRFVSDAAHELKTPLTAIKTSLEVNLRNKNLNLKQAQKTIEETILDINDLNTLANSLLQGSRYQHTNLNKKDEIELEKVVKKVIRKMKEQAKKKEIVINLKTVGDTLIKGNEQALKELITILLDNAIKFNKQGGKIDITIETEHKNIVLEVTNTGDGIHEKDLPFIFDRFYKSEKSRSKTERDGFGLGLSIAREIVTAHNGTIKTRSKTTKKSTTTFIVKLPKNK